MVGANFVTAGQGAGILCLLLLLLRSFAGPASPKLLPAFLAFRALRARSS